MAIKKNNMIEKRNVLNEIRCNNMHLQELRFFTIYLSRINARNPEKTRLVRFPVSDFLAIMELDNINISQLKRTTNSLLGKVINVPTESGGYRAFQLFKECAIEKDETKDEWYIEIDAHDRALPLMFDFKRDYFTYELWNALRLTSSNQLRMYEILKQYEKRGERILTLEELKNLLFIGENEYSRFDNFKSKVLESCQKALEENTDIYFEYELLKKARGKVYAVKFSIFRNREYKDQLTLNEFINMRSDVINEDEVSEVDEVEYQHIEKLEFLSGACNNEFSQAEMQVIYDILLKILSFDELSGTEAYDYLKRKYDELLSRAERINIDYRFGYLKKILEVAII